MELLDSAMASADLLYFGGYDDYGILSKFVTDSSSSSPSSLTTTVKSSKRSISKEFDSCKGSNKKEKREASTSKGTIKVRKDNLGDKIATLQQLVSPFGKSDTASVLQEALGYIHFLHEQVQVLASPYLQLQPNDTGSQQDGSTDEDQSREGELRCRGLCLVPISSFEEGNNNLDDAHLDFPNIESILCTKRNLSN